MGRFRPQGDYSGFEVMGQPERDEITKYLFEIILHQQRQMLPSYIVFLKRLAQHIFMLLHGLRLETAYPL